jgi:hypothetical protein
MPPKAKTSKSDKGKKQKQINVEEKFPIASDLLLKYPGHTEVFIDIFFFFCDIKH